jgi:hypothetical protein
MPDCRTASEIGRERLKEVVIQTDSLTDAFATPEEAALAAALEILRGAERLYVVAHDGPYLSRDHEPEVDEDLVLLARRLRSACRAFWRAIRPDAAR